MLRGVLGQLMLMCLEAYQTGTGIELSLTIFRQLMPYATDSSNRHKDDILLQKS